MDTAVDQETAVDAGARIEDSTAQPAPPTVHPTREPAKEATA